METFIEDLDGSTTPFSYFENLSKGKILPKYHKCRLYSLTSQYRNRKYDDDDPELKSRDDVKENRRTKVGEKQNKNQMKLATMTKKERRKASRRQVWKSKKK